MNTTTLPMGMSLEEFRNVFVLTVSAAQYPAFDDAEFRKTILTLPGELVTRLIGWRRVAK